jgi:hypothetical protein
MVMVTSMMTAMMGFRVCRNNRSSQNNKRHGSKK